MNFGTSLKLIAGCLLIMGGLSSDVQATEQQLVFKSPEQAEQELSQQEIMQMDKQSDREVLKKALGYDFDMESFRQQYQCDKSKGYRIQVQHREPFLMVVDDFLTPEECDHFIAAGLPALHRSTVVSTDEHHVSEWRTSFTAFMERSQDDVFRCVEERAASLVSLPPENIEPLQLVRYEKGQQYREHHDWFDRDEAGMKEMERGGQRVITIYLNSLNDDQGGQTGFPNLNMSVPARKGRAAFWFNIGVSGKEHDDNLHAGLPVNYGTKYGLNVWIREQEFPSYN